MKRFQILSGLPAYGELPEQFSSTGMGTHSEGMVVEFFPNETSSSWIGNFQRGLTSLDKVLAHPNGSSAIVIAGGECYIIEIENRKLKESFGGMYETVFCIFEKNIVILGTSIDFDALNASGHLWQSQRISWDGLRHLKQEENILSGEAWSLGNTWIPFSLDIDSGKHTGGAKI